MSRFSLKGICSIIFRVENTKRWRRIVTSEYRWLFTLSLFAWWPFLSLISSNLNENINVNIVLVALLVNVVAIGITIMVKKFHRGASYNRIATPVTLGTVAFFSYPIAIMVTQWAGGWWAVYYLITWAVGFIFAVAIGLYIGRFNSGRTALFISAIILVALPLTKILWTISVRPPQLAVTVEEADKSPRTEPMPNRMEFAWEKLVSHPNIYYLILDSYPRADYLKKSLGYDNHQFLDDLKKKEFTVVEKSLSNYAETHMSNATTLNMDYTPTRSYFDLETNSDKLPIFDVNYGGSSVLFEGLRANGYSIFAGLFTESEIGFCDPLCKGTKWRFNFKELAILKLTPAFGILEEFFSGDLVKSSFNFRVSMDISQKDLQRLRRKEPFILYYHSLAPHPPFFHNADCSIHDQTGYLSLQHNDPKREKYMADFRDEISCQNRKVLRIIENIVKSDPDAVIVVQGDHGIRFLGLPAIEEDKPTSFNRYFSNLNAIRVPKKCRDWIYSTMSNVNTFRLVVACLIGRKPDFVPDLQFLTQDLQTQIVTPETVPQDRFR